MMKALPIPIMAKNRAKVSMFMFNILQASLIAFSTTGSVQAFEFYDKLNKKRVMTVSDIILAQKTQLENVQRTMNEVQAKVQQNERILSEYQEMWQYLGNDWKTKILEMHDNKVQKE